MEEIARGALSKMTARLESNAPVQYACLDDREVAVNPLIGRPLRLEYLGSIFCTHCGRKTKKSFSQGYCYPCSPAGAVRQLHRQPEKCHYEQGTCREPEWGERFCMTDHVVYLANSSGVKVGITRASQIPTRWIDQGARQALPILRVATRQQSGSQVADRTNWRAMLKGEAEPVDLAAVREQLFDQCADGLRELQQRFGLQAIQPVIDLDPLEIAYPVEAYPSKVASLDLEKRLSSKARFAVSRAST